jgi:hypothetical protein
MIEVRDIRRDKLRDDTLNLLIDKGLDDYPLKDF